MCLFNIKQYFIGMKIDDYFLLAFIHAVLTMIGIIGIDNNKYIKR